MYASVPDTTQFSTKKAKAIAHESIAQDPHMQTKEGDNKTKHRIHIGLVLASVLLVYVLLPEHHQSTV